MLIKLPQSLPRSLPLRIHTVYLDSMTAASHMQAPIPTMPNLHWLGVQTIVPTADNELGPAFVVAGDFTGKGAPGEFVLGREVLDGDGVPYVAAIGGDFDTFGPAASA